MDESSYTLDGNDAGLRTPALIRPVKAGAHVVAVELEGYGRRVETVSVVVGATAEIDVTLEPKLGTLTVMTRGSQDDRPCRGRIGVDGRDMGATPWKGQVLAVQHRVSVDCGGRAVTQNVVVGHNENKVMTVIVDNPTAGTMRPVAPALPTVAAVSPVASPALVSAGASGQQPTSTVAASSTRPADRYAAFDARRTRASFQARVSGGLDLNRAANGVGSLVQIGVGTGRWFDIHTGVGFPSYSWVTDFELNLWPYGRFIPTLGMRVGLGFHPDHNAHSLDFTAGLEMWAATWLAFYVKLGVGYSWNLTHDTSGVYVPGWLGVEFRY